MRLGCPLTLMSMTMEERDTLERWARRPKTAQALAFRARLVLACASGQSNTAVAAHYRVCHPTVGKWRARFRPSGWTACSMSPVPGHLVISPMRTWSGS